MKKRNLGLDLLRILSMLMIILLHSIDHSGLEQALVPGTALYYYELFLYSAVQVCVNCFVMISGYFLVTSSFRIEKLIKLWIEVIFYSLVIKVIMMAAGEIPVSAASLVSCFVPVLTGRYWFVTIYFGMYLLSPFYNIAVRAMTKNQHRNLCVLLFVLFSVLVSIHPGFKGMNAGGGWGLAGFTVLYIFAAYFRLHYTPTGNWKKPLAVYLLCPVMIAILIGISERLGLGLLTAVFRNWPRYDSFPVYIATCSLFVVFLNINVHQGGTIVAKIAPAVFGVYLIHAHANVCTVPMWGRLGMIANMGKAWYPLYQLAVAAAIFVVCVLMDLLRQKLFRLIRVDGAVRTLGSWVERKVLPREEYDESIDSSRQ